MYSGVTPTIVLRYLNRMLGTLVQELEISEEEMMRVVFQESLPTFSKYFPYRYRMTITNENILDKKYPNAYLIPNEDRLEITGIHDIWLDNMNQFGGSLLPLTNDPFQSQLLADQLSMRITPTTFEFRPPNVVIIRPRIYNLGSAMIEVKAQHPKHLKTIPMDMRDQFLRLCLDDVLLTLYPIRHRFENYNTPYGQLAPFFSMVDNAQSDKEQLLEQWKSEFLKQGNVKRIWIS